jgi:DNA (cytosine-5)-methyltransferase 1
VNAEVLDHASGRLSERDAEIVAHVPPGGNWRDLPIEFESARVAQIRESAAAGEGSRSTYYGRLSPDRPSYTISTYFNRPGNGCFIHPSAPRLITIREAARLQGFPDTFSFRGRGRARFLQVGNAVPPLLSFQVARSLGLDPGASVVDLFSGAGGLGLGFEWAGHRIVASVDNDSSCIESQTTNGTAPDRALVRDLASASCLREVIDEIEDLNDRRPIDVLVGGPPCQGFSTAGLNLRDDPRNQLVGVFLDAVAALKPRMVLMENVPALGFRRSRPTLEAVMEALSTLGYSVETAVLHAEGYGVPQLRRRLFIQGRQDGEAPVWPRPIRQIMRPHQLASQPFGAAAASSPLPVSVSEAIGDLPEEAALDPDAGSPYGTEPASSYQRWARGEIGATDWISESAGPFEESAERQAA